MQSARAKPGAAGVKLHDIHHVLTGYDTTWRGKAEIGAWEIASGCGRHYAAWVLNLWAMAIGLVIAPGRALRAWRRGDSARNLYREEFGSRLLDVEVGTLRARIRLDEGLARRAQAKVAALVRPRHVAEAEALGASVILLDLPGASKPFVDVVIETVGGELARRSAALLVPGGCLVSSVKRVDIESPGRNDVRSEYLIVEITTERLTQIAELLEAGELSVRVGTVLPLESARQAHELMEAEAARMHGKIVLRASEADSSSEDP